jgi:rfaE bifunctional protein kinase chain/domain
VFSSSDVVFSSTALVNQVSETVLGNPVRTQLHPLDLEHDLSSEAMLKITERIAGKRIVVVGETIIDTYIRCTWPEISSESPMLALRPIEHTRFDAGAAIIARHLASQGADVIFITTLPGTNEAQQFTERMKTDNIAVHAIHAGNRITTKDRYLVGREKKVKIDHSADITLDTRAREQLVQLVEEHTLGADACIISDYGLGMFTPHLLSRVTNAARSRTPILTGDVSGRRSSLMSMNGSDLLTPSEHELRSALRDFDSSLPTIVWRALEKTSARSMAVTLDEEGVILFTRKPADDPAGREEWSSRLNSVHIPSFTSHAIDTLGCGDALLALTTGAMTAGVDPCRSLVLGSLGAAIQAATMGNDAIQLAQIQSTIREHLSLRPDAQQIELKPTSMKAPPRWTSVS